MTVYNRFLSFICILALCLGVGFHFQAEAGSKIDNIKTFPWIDSQENEGVVYFLFEFPSRIERYSLIDETFSDPIPLSNMPTAFAVDSEGLYVSFGDHISYLTLDGSTERHIHKTTSDINNLVTFKDFLYLQKGNTFTSINKFSGEIIDSREYFYSVEGISVSPKQQKIFARSTGVSPSDIIQIALNADGSLGKQVGSPYHGDYPGASKTYLFPDETRIADSAGITYMTTDLTYNNSLAGKVDDIAFYENIPIVLRGNTLSAHSNTLLKTGEYVLQKQPLSIYVEGEFIYAFRFSAKNKVCVERVPLSELKANELEEPINPINLVYTPDAVHIDSDEVLYLLSKENLSIFRWSIPQQCYLETIPLAKAPAHMTYSPVNNTIYLAYKNGALTQIALNTSTREYPFANSPQAPLGIAAAGNYLFVCDPTGAWCSHFTYDFQGQLISVKDWNYSSSEYIWSDINQKMYFLRDGVSPNNLQSEEIRSDGTIGARKETPYHGMGGFEYPIRVAPNGSIVLLGSGLIFDAKNLKHIGSLPNSINDAVWAGNALFTLCSLESGESLIQKWDTKSNLQILETQQLAGKPIKMFSVSDGVMAVSELDGKPEFTMLAL